MEKNIFLTYKTSLITKQRQILFAVVMLFLVSQLANVFNYNNVENLLIFIVFGLMTFGIYISMGRSKLKVMHWLAMCMGVFLWGIIDTIRSVNQDFLLRDSTQISYLDLFMLLPMGLFLVAISIFLIVKIQSLDKNKKIQLAADGVNVLFLVGTLTYCIVNDFGDLSQLFHPQGTDKFVTSITICINLLILFVSLIEIFTSNILYIRYSGFYFIVASVIFTLLNLYVSYNEFLHKDYDFKFQSLYLVPFFLLMFGAFYLKGENKHISVVNIGIHTTSKLIPMISAFLLLIKKGDFGSASDLLILSVIVAGAIVNYYVRVSNLNDEALQKDKILRDSKEKEKHSKTNELEMLNLSLEGVSEKDYLTSLGNRASLMNELKSMCNLLEDKQEIAVYYINVSRFKNINTSYGHGVGDKILKAIAKSIREVCNRQETIARIGADEFVVLAKMELDSHTKRMNLGYQLREAIEKPIQIEKYHFSIKSVVGIHVVNKTNISDPRTIIKKADMAMYYAKQNPVLNPMLYNDMIDSEMHLNSSIEIALKKANLQDDFQVYFQPIYDIKNSKMIYVESLLRWQSQEYGLKEANEFMDIASLNSDILNDICTLGISKTIEQAVMWQNKGLKIPKISINVAKIQSTSEKFVNDFMLALNSHHLNPRHFELEFSEDIWKNDEETLDKIFALLDKNSIDVCVDDFGSGYTSFVYIRKYKIDRIKIASDFVSQITNSKLDMQIVTAIINLAKSMKLKATAKGVESLEILNLLKDLDCAEMQGYALSRPMSAVEFEDHLRQNPQMIAEI